MTGTPRLTKQPWPCEGELHIVIEQQREKSWRWTFGILKKGKVEEHKSCPIFQTCFDQFLLEEVRGRDTAAYISKKEDYTKEPLTDLKPAEFVSKLTRRRIEEEAQGRRSIDSIETVDSEQGKQSENLKIETTSEHPTLRNTSSQSQTGLVTQPAENKGKTVPGSNTEPEITPQPNQTMAGPAAASGNTAPSTNTQSSTNAGTTTGQTQPPANPGNPGGGPAATTTGTNQPSGPSTKGFEFPKPNEFTGAVDRVTGSTEAREWIASVKAYLQFHKISDESQQVYFALHLCKKKAYQWASIYIKW